MIYIITPSGPATAILEKHEVESIRWYHARFLTSRQQLAHIGYSHISSRRFPGNLFMDLSHRPRISIEQNNQDFRGRAINMIPELILAGVIVGLSGLFLWGLLALSSSSSASEEPTDQPPVRSLSMFENCYDLCKKESGQTSDACAVMCGLGWP